MTIFWYPHLRIFRPRKLEVLLLVDSLQVGNLRLNFIPDRNIVKGEFNFGNRLGFQVQIDDLPLKCCILGQKPKNLTSGSNIAWGPPKILPTGRSCRQDFLDSSYQRQRVQFIINGFKTSFPAILEGIQGDPPNDFRR